MENPPFEDVFPIENGDFPLLCLFTGGYLEFDTNPKQNNETDPAKCATFWGFLVVSGRYNLTRSYKWWAPTSSKWKEVTPLCRVK